MRDTTGGASRPKPRYSTKGPTTAKPSKMPNPGVSPVSGRRYAAPARKRVNPRSERGTKNTWKGPGHLADSAVTAVDQVVPVRAAAKLAQGGEMSAADWLALASVVPVPGAKALKGVSASVRAASKGGTTVGKAIGREAEAAVRGAVKGTPKAAAKPKPKAAPKTKPVAPKESAYKSKSGYTRALNNHWNNKVPAWNKANPNDTIKVPTSGPAVGKAATASRKEVATSDAGKSASEAATITAGKRASAKNNAVKKGVAKRTAAKQDPELPKGRNPRSKTKAMPESSKPPVKAVDENADVIDKFAKARSKGNETGPGRANPKQRAADFRQRLADVRAQRNSGALPSYETQEVMGTKVPRSTGKAKQSVMPPRQVKRTAVSQERLDRAGLPAKTKGNSTNQATASRTGVNKIPNSGEKVTKTQAAKWRKQHDPAGGDPLDPKTSLAKYPAAIRERIVRERAALSESGSAATEDLMSAGARAGDAKSPSSRAPGRDTKIPAKDAARLRTKKPRPGVGKGSQPKERPGRNAAPSGRKAANMAGKNDPVANRFTRMEKNQAMLDAKSRGTSGKAASDGSTKPTSKGTSTNGDRGFWDKPDERAAGSNVLKPTERIPGTGTKPVAKKPSVKKTTAKKTTAPKESAEPKAPAAKKPTAKKTAAKKTAAKKTTPKAATKADDNVTPITEAPSVKKGNIGPKPGAKPAAKKTAAPKKPSAKDEPKARFDSRGRKLTDSEAKRVTAQEAAAKRASGAERASKAWGSRLNKSAASRKMAKDVLTGKNPRGKIRKLAGVAAASAVGAGVYGKTKQMEQADAAKASASSKAPAKADTKGGPAPKADDKKKTPNKVGSKTIKKDKSGDKFVTDRYGRRISPAEYKRRLAEKKARSEAKTPEEKLRLYKQQVARREKYRTSAGTRKKYGTRSTRKTKKPPVKVGSYLRAAVKVNKKK